MAVVLNRSLASGLGRPDLISGNVASRAQVALPPVAYSSASVAAAYTQGSRVAGVSGPALGLIVLVAGMGAFLWWVHPHLA